MRLLLLSLFLISSTYASDAVEFFQKDKKNKILCHIGQYSYKVLSQKNAKVVKIHGRSFFKLKGENLYFLNNSCQAIKDRDGIVF
jgi:hypothetical protein